MRVLSPRIESVSPQFFQARSREIWKNVPYCRRAFYEPAFSPGSKSLPPTLWRYSSPEIQTTDTFPIFSGYKNCLLFHWGLAFPPPYTFPFPTSLCYGTSFAVALKMVFNFLFVYEKQSPWNPLTGQPSLSPPFCSSSLVCIRDEIVLVYWLLVLIIGDSPDEVLFQFPNIQENRSSLSFFLLSSWATFLPWN